MLGAYLVLHPRAKVNMFAVIRFIQLPAWFYLLLWIGLQILALSQTKDVAGLHIAYWAHIGGFVAGIFLSIFVTPRQNPKDF